MPTTPTAADVTAVVRALPDLPFVQAAAVVELLTAQRRELLAAFAPTVTAYDEARADWQQANEDEDGAPSVSECETWSDRLEECAHAFADTVAELAAGTPTIPPAGSSDVAGILSRLAAVTDGEDGDTAELELLRELRDAVTGRTAPTLAWAGDPRIDLDDDDPRQVADKRPAPDDLAVFAHWSTAHDGVNVEVDLPDGLPLTVHVNDGRVFRWDGQTAEYGDPDLRALHADDVEARRDALTDELVRAVEAAGIESADLDDAVHDAGSLTGTQANNDGIAGQVAYLVARVGTGGARQVIEEATGRTLPDPVELARLVAELDAVGGRDPELADRIDALTAAQTTCDRHGGPWGTDDTCPRCTDVHGGTRHVEDAGPLTD